MNAKVKTVKKDVGAIAAAMRVRYPANAYAMLFEVGNSTGFGCNRHADALVMSLWPSRGLDVTGFEFKVSRTDWQKEMKDPSKAEAVMQFCDFWTLVVADESIVKPGELPAPWGLGVLNGKTIKTVKEPQRLKPSAWPREFLAAVLRRVSEPIAAVDADAIRAAEHRAREDERQKQSDLILRLRTSIRTAEDQAEAARRKVAQFEADTGIGLDSCGRWQRSDLLSREEYVAAMRAIADGSGGKILQQLHAAAQQARQAADDVGRSYEAVRKLIAQG